ncbi:MAG: MmgE/PrpD family protein, partial [Dehalococcoidia bacterium]|nr:MmgE/PrpD family protein [Dehalococcoidia bacterium]
LGAVAAVGRLVGASPEEIRAAMDLASTLTLVTSWQTAFVGATVRNLYAGVGAELATRAIDLVRAGFSGEPDGVGVVFGGILTPSINRRRVVIALGDRWEFARSYVKPYAFARFGHAAIDALRAIREAVPFAADDIAAIDIATGALGARMRDPRPTTELGARFSLPWAVGAWVVRGACGPDEFGEEALADSTIASVAARVTVREDAEWEALNPQWRGATVRVTLRDGRVLVDETDHALGDPERPLPLADVRAKFLAQVAPVVGQDRANAAADALLALETMPDSRALIALMHPTEAPR